MGAFQVTSSIQTKGFVMSRQPHGSHCLENAMGFSSVSEIGTKTKYVFLVINHSITTGVYAFLSQQHFAHNGYSINMSAWKEWSVAWERIKLTTGQYQAGRLPCWQARSDSPFPEGLLCARHALLPRTEHRTGQTRMLPSRGSQLRGHPTS